MSATAAEPYLTTLIAVVEIFSVATFVQWRDVVFRSLSYSLTGLMVSLQVTGPNLISAVRGTKSNRAILHR